MQHGLQSAEEQKVLGEGGRGISGAAPGMGSSGTLRPPLAFTLPAGWPRLHACLATTSAQHGALVWQGAAQPWPQARPRTGLLRLKGTLKTLSSTHRFPGAATTRLQGRGSLSILALLTFGVGDS